MNEPLIVLPTDPPVTLYVVAVLYVRMPQFSSSLDRRLIAVQFTRPPRTRTSSSNATDR